MLSYLLWCLLFTFLSVLLLLFALVVFFFLFSLLLFPLSTTAVPYVLVLLIAAEGVILLALRSTVCNTSDLRICLPMTFAFTSVAFFAFVFCLTICADVFAILVVLYFFFTPLLLFCFFASTIVCSYYYKYNDTKICEKNN